MSQKPRSSSALSSFTRITPALPESEDEDRLDTIERMAIYATTYVGGNYDNSYFFLERDSLWRIERFIEFPDPDLGAL